MVNAVGPEALQRLLDDGLDVLGPTVEATPPLSGGGIDVEAELGVDHDPISYRSQRLPNQFFVGEGPVDLGGVEKRDAVIDASGGVQGGGRGAAVGPDVGA